MIETMNYWFIKLSDCDTKALHIAIPRKPVSKRTPILMSSSDVRYESDILPKPKQNDWNAQESFSKINCDDVSTTSSGRTTLV